MYSKHKMNGFFLPVRNCKNLARVYAAAAKAVEIGVDPVSVENNIAFAIEDTKGGKISKANADSYVRHLLVRLPMDQGIKPVAEGTRY